MMPGNLEMGVKNREMKNFNPWPGICQCTDITTLLSRSLWKCYVPFSVDLNTILYTNCHDIPFITLIKFDHSIPSPSTRHRHPPPLYSSAHVSQVPYERNLPP